MIKQFCLAGIMSFLVFFLFSGETHAQTPDLAYKPLPKSLLWEITGNGLKRPSYLYGTIHLIPRDSFFVTEATRERMAEADELVLEVPIAEMGLTDMLGMIQYMNMPDGKTLKSILPEQDYAYLDSFLNTFQGGGMFSTLSLNGIERMQPMMSLQQISAAYCADQGEEDTPALDNSLLEDGDFQANRLMGISMGDNVVYELYFTEKFQDLDKPVSGLETAREQMEILTSIPVEEQAAAMMEAVRKPESLCGEMDILVSVYRTQDIQRMVDLSAEDRNMGNYLDRFLDQRNKNWIPQIHQKVQSGKCIFIAVGAAHLAGPNGVIHLLRKAGYSLKPLY